MLVQTPGVFVISTVIIGYEDTVESVTHYSYVSLKKEVIAALNRKSCLLIASHKKFIPEFCFCKKATVIKKLQTFFTEAL